MSPLKLSKNSRKEANPYRERLIGNWKEDHPVKCTQCHKFHGDNQSREESQLVEAKTSEETFSEANSAGNTEDEYSSIRGMQEGEYQSISYPCRRMKTYAEVVLAKLKELQWRRDLLERHYTSGVKKIMNDYFFWDGRSPNGQAMIAPGNEERMRAGGMKKNQSYGVRLECGCIHNCDRTRQKILSNSAHSPSTSANYSSECKGRCPSRSEAVRSS
ncbi:uncharacterized protein LOC107046360 [Diachasma alloeum]|uniref:uncharacterized protein LOC107046360 n=1 Tax=Diachasma alloeum TaxID=454923 RepID=UPI000738478A|nr:uncharacterized protein LOC107046360 [Diachasma alloeum]